MNEGAVARPDWKIWLYGSFSFRKKEKTRLQPSFSELWRTLIRPFARPVFSRAFRFENSKLMHFWVSQTDDVQCTRFALFDADGSGSEPMPSWHFLQKRYPVHDTEIFWIPYLLLTARKILRPEYFGWQEDGCLHHSGCSEDPLDVMPSASLIPRSAYAAPQSMPYSCCP